MLIQLVLDQCLENKNITIYGDGSQTRSFCYIDDTVEGLIKLMNMDIFVGPINIGNPNEISINELSNIIINLINKIDKINSQIIYMNLPNDDPMKRKPDISKAIKYLDWIPKIKLEEGLIKTIEYFKNL